MIKIIYGTKGTGKTKRIIDTANQSIESCDGHIVFVSDTKRYMYEIKRDIRFLQMAEYKVSGQEQLLAFLKGVVAANSDNELIFIDGVARILNMELSEMQSFYEGLDTISTELGVDFVLTVSSDVLPDYMTGFTIL